LTSLQIWFVGDTSPSISETLTVGGTPFNLSSSTAVFKMRPVGSTALKVNAAAVCVSPKTNGTVRYDWQAADVNTVGQYIAWFEITTSGAVQTAGEQVLDFRAHAPDAIPGYCELEQVKSSLSLSGQSYADLDIRGSIQAASRTIDLVCGRRFYTDGNASAQRFYDASSLDLVLIDDAISISALDIDTAWNGTFSTSLGTSFWNPGPYNNPSLGRPYEWIRRRPLSSAQIFPDWIPMSIRVTGQFGWSAVPGPIQEACAMLAHRYMRRKREAPFGIMTVSAESARAIKIPQSDPDVYQLLLGYIRNRPFST